MEVSCEVVIAGDTMRMIVDTGSSDVLVLNPTRLCPSLGEFKLKYAAGRVQGRKCVGDVSIGGQTSKRVHYGQAEVMEAGVQAVSAAGVLGLGFQGLSQVTSPPFFAGLHQDSFTLFIPPPASAAAFGRQAAAVRSRAGQLAFGDSLAPAGRGAVWQYTPLVRLPGFAEYTYWAFRLRRLSFVPLAPARGRGGGQRAGAGAGAAAAAEAAAAAAAAAEAGAFSDIIVLDQPAAVAAAAAGRGSTLSRAAVALSKAFGLRWLPRLEATAGAGGFLGTGTGTGGGAEKRARLAQATAAAQAGAETVLCASAAGDRSGSAGAGTDTDVFTGALGHGSVAADECFGIVDSGSAGIGVPGVYYERAMAAITANHRCRTVPGAWGETQCDHCTLDQFPVLLFETDPVRVRGHFALE
jgi:hypothetical protein